MNRSIWMATMFTALGLAAGEKPAVVNVPVPVAGPAGPQGATGDQGVAGSAGATGKTGDSTTVIVVPPAAN